MNWVRLIALVVSAGVVSSLTDWFFAGDWIHRRYTYLHSVLSTGKLAAAIWLIGPLPLILTDAAFMKLHRVFVASYALGWLVKLMIVAVAAGVPSLTHIS
jgi:hypothetical protein